MDRDRFIHICAKMMANWGMPMTSARVLAYLFLQSKPAGHDQIAADLGISKAGSWAATRHLEQVKQLERFAEPGSKRALYLPKDDVARAMFNYSRLMGRMGMLMSQGAEVASGDVAVARLQMRSSLYMAVHDAIEDTMESFLSSHRQAVAK